MKDSFIFYGSFLRAINTIKKRDIQGELALAIIEYGITGEQPECGDIVSMAMELIKPQLDANNVRYENSKKGGAPIGNKNALKQPSVEFSKQLKQPNVNENKNKNEDENENILKKERNKEKKEIYLESHLTANEIRQKRDLVKSFGINALNNNQPAIRNKAIILNIDEDKW